MNWYHVETSGRVDRYGVNKTTDAYMHSSCTWTEEALLAALRPVAEKDGISNLRIVSFRTHARPGNPESKVIDLDSLLGI